MRIPHWPLARALMLGAAAVLAAAPARAAPVSLEGWLTVVWSDAVPGAVGPLDALYTLNTDDGRRLQVEADPALHGRLQALDRQRVRLQGELLPPAAPDPAGASAAAVFRVSAAHAAPTPPQSSGGAAGAMDAAAPQLGRKPWINLLCKFADYSAEPREPSYFTSLFASTRPGLDYYWKELSNGQMSVAGSRATRWYTLPQPRSYYVHDNGFGAIVLEHYRALEDCASAADADVHFPDYAGINLVFNEVLDCCAWGGGAFLERDGVSRIYGTTWLPPWGWTQHTVVAHEMGHGFGLPHSRGNQQTYRNLHDVMSDLYYNCAAANDATLGCLGQHTIGHHKNMLGWVPPSATYVAAPGSRQAIRIEKLERPAAGHYHLAIIPILGSTRFYTVEARRRYSFDTRLPGAAIVIHDVDTTSGEPANVVDGDGNGDPYDAGTRWTVGETFADAANGISVSVDATDGGTGFMVTIERRGDVIFADGFESGNLSAWSAARVDGGDLAATTGARLAGNFGLRALIDDNAQIHTTDHTPAAERSYRARFRFDPNGVAMTDNNRFIIFGAYDTTLTAAVELRRRNGLYQLRAVARLDNGTQRSSTWTYIEDRVYDLELSWRAASGAATADGVLRLAIDGALSVDLGDLQNANPRVERGLLGAVSGVDTGTRGTLYFDAFESQRW